MSEPQVKARERRVMVKDDVKLLARAIKMLTREGLVVEIRCANCKAKIAHVQVPDGMDLLCDCARRVVRKGL